MSRNYTVLNKSIAEGTNALARYGELIRQLFQSPATVAIIGRGASYICEEIAAEIATRGKRIVIIPVDTLLRVNPLPTPYEIDYLPGATENVWHWPHTASPEAGPSHRQALVDIQWLDTLRASFDVVLLDCATAATSAGQAEVAALADAAVMAVEAGIATRTKVQRDQRSLQSKGVKLVGCILVRKGTSNPNAF